MTKIIRRALIDSVGTVLYIILVASLMFYLQDPDSPDNLPAPIIQIAMLSLFVCSAAITGFLVFGKPVMLYIDGKKKEAVALLGYTIGILVLFTIIFFILLITYF